LRSNTTESFFSAPLTVVSQSSPDKSFLSKRWTLWPLCPSCTHGLHSNKTLW